MNNILSALHAFFVDKLAVPDANFLNANVINTVDENPLVKVGQSSADFPQLLVETLSVTGPGTSSSSSARWVITYQVSCASGQMSSDSIHFLTSWIIHTILDLNFNVGIFEYKDLFPLKRIVFSSSNIGMTPLKNVQGYSSLTSFTAEILCPYSVFLPGDR